MPLHTTTDHDGRALPGGKSPKTGVHSKIDSLIEKLAFQPQELAKNQKIKPLDDLMAELMPGIMAEIMAARSHIDKVCKLEADLPPETGAWTASPAVKAFATGRTCIGSLYGVVLRRRFTLRHGASRRTFNFPNGLCAGDFHLNALAVHNILHREGVSKKPSGESLQVKALR